MIRAGRVTVDGVAAHLGQKIDPATARVEVDGVPLPLRPDARYYLVYKPPGVVSTASDPQGRPTVVGLVPADTRVYPVGRLDADSEGLLLLTNDGALTEHLTHPRHQVPKTYLVRVRGRVGAGPVRRLQQGIELEDGPARAQRARLVQATPSESLVEVVMGEGRKREVRRMFAALGHEVTALVRTAIGPVRDPDLAPGDWRPLTTTEVRLLYRAGGGSGGGRR